MTRSSTTFTIHHAIRNGKNINLSKVFITIKY